MCPSNSLIYRKRLTHNVTIKYMGRAQLYLHRKSLIKFNKKEIYYEKLSLIGFIAQLIIISANNY